MFASYRLFCLVSSALLITQCVPLHPSQVYPKDKNALVDMPEVLPELSDVPPPQRKIAVALYRFPDKTGAFKPNEDFAVYSSAVPKSADSIVMEALTAAGRGKWFRVLEREGLDMVLRERAILEVAYDEWKSKKAIASAVARKVAAAQTAKKESSNRVIDVNPANQFAASPRAPQHMPKVRVKNNAAPAMAAAEYVIEGGIIGYDSDVYTGGGGVRFLNIGGFGEVRKDAVTVNLRFVSVKTGDVVISSTVTKGVLSQKLQGSGFGYVSLDRMLEAEVGVGHNEPVFHALNLAVQAALLNAMDKGVKRGIWTYAEPKQKTPPTDKILPSGKKAENKKSEKAKRVLSVKKVSDMYGAAFACKSDKK